MAEYSAADIVGKIHLIVKNKVKAYWDFPNSKDFFYFQSGSDAGVPYSYVKNNTQDQLWWQFLIVDSKGKERYYYIQQKQGVFDEQAIKDQGAKSDAEKLKDNQEKNIEYYLKNYGVPAFLLVAGVKIIQTAIQKT